MDKCKTRLGYNAVPPPYTGNFMPPKPDLVYPSLDDFVDVSESVVEKPTVETNEPKTARKENGAPIIKDWVFESEEEDVPKIKTVEMFNKPSFAKINFVKSTEQVKSSRNISVDKNRQNTPSPRRNKRNWNQKMCQKLGSDFEMFNKACHVCGSFDHLKNDCNNWYNNGRFAKPVWANVQRVNKQNFSKLTHSSPKRNMVSRTVLTRSGPISLNTARPVNTVQPRSTMNNARHVKNVFNNAYSTMRRPFNKVTAANNSNFNKKVNTVKGKRVNTDYEEIDEGFVAFGGGLTCVFAKATPNESNLWHKRLGHVNFKTMNKPVRGNLVRGLPSKPFEINQTCVACQKGKQHRASCKTKTVSSISQPLQMLHMDLFGPTFVKSLMKKMYCLVVTDDFSRFSWVFFLATKDETSEILKTFITGIENLIDLRVKVIRCDNGTEFKNRVMNQFCEMKGIKREFSVARTPQQNGVAERKNRTLIEAARTMLADSKLPTTFWAEAVNTACYVQNRVLVIKPHNKTPYELFLGRKPALSFMRPFGCPVTILNTIDHLGKFDGKADEGFFVGYSTNSKAFRVFNSRTRIVEENLHVQFSENTPNIAGSGPNWLFDIDALTNKTMKFRSHVGCTESNNGNVGEEEKMDVEHPENENSEVPNTEEPRVNQEQDESTNSTNNINTINSTVNTASIEDNAVDENIVYGWQQRINHKDFQNCLFACFLSQVEPKKVWTLMDLPHGKRAISTKWVFRNKKDDRGIMVRNKARLLAQGYTQENGIDYDKVFAPIARIEAIRLFLIHELHCLSDGCEECIFVWDN
ncbi:putative ribonuclease H-like domain-containing protein [Tanacetum coccineum]